MCIGFRQTLARMNKQLEREEEEQGRKPGFRYIL
jgi:hypothetical protein